MREASSLNTEKKIQITEIAADMIRKFAAKSGLMENIGLRIEIIGGNESGYAYDLFFDKPEFGDFQFESGGVSILVRTELMSLLDQTVVDWSAGDNGAGFILRNPNEPAR